MTVAQRTETSRTVCPTGIPAVHALLARWVKLRILDVERLDALVVKINELQVVKLLQHKMARIVIDVGTRMVVQMLQKHLESSAVIKVFSRMQFVANVHARLVERVQNRFPAAGQFTESGFRQASGPLRPRVHERPHQRTRKRDVRMQAQVLAGFGRPFQLLHRPFLAFGFVAVYFLGRKAVEHGAVSRMHRHQLPLQVRG